jgi:site-specific DNA recombinase
MNKKAIVYTRVSTEEQAERGYSLQSQIKACREYALDNSMNIVAEITDDYTGSTLDRPGFNELESFLARKEARIVIVTEEDRLSRNAANTLAIYEEWEEAGIELHYCDKGRVSFGEESILVNGVPILVAQYERVKTRKRTMKGRYDKAKSGKPVLNGNPPYGYRKKGVQKNAELVKYEPELKVVRDIFKWYIEGNGAGAPMSQREIARKLNEMGIPATTSGKEWSNTAVHRILHQEIYAGVTYYGKTKTKNKGNKRIIIAKLPKDQWIKIPVPHLAVIDKNTFEAVEARKARNIQLQLRNNKRRYLMSGHFRCSTCGQVMVGYHRQGHLRYQCTTHWNNKRLGKESCPTSNRSIVCHKVDDLVWDWIYKLLTDEKSLEDGLNKMVENNKDQTGTKRKRVNTLEKLIAKRENSIQRLMNELNEGAYEDDYTRNLFRQTIKENTDVIKELEKERDALNAELAQVELNAEFQQEIKAMAAKIRDRLSNANFDGKRAVMDKLDVKAVFRFEEGVRWLDASCRLIPESVELHPSRSGYRDRCERLSD